MKIGIIGLGIAGQALKDNAKLVGYTTVLTYDSKQTNNTLTLIDNLDILCISAGIDLQHCNDSIIINLYHAALEAKIPIVNDIELFFRHFAPKTIAITGSYGKSTTATMIHKTLLSQGIKNSLRGNIGIPIWQAPFETECMVLEVSNNQVELLESLNAEIGIITNIFPHHLTRYDNNLETYKALKLKLFKMSNIKICGNYSLSAQINNTDICKIDPDSLSHDTNSKIAGIAVSKFLNSNNPTSLIEIAKKIYLEHRFEVFYENTNVKFINDSKATDVEPVIQAINNVNLSNNEKIILICGGAYDQASINNWKDLIPFLSKISEIILFGQAGEHIKEILDFNRSIVYKTFAQMCMNLSKHQEKTRKNVFLLSPGCQSFDEFKNFEERGKCFKSLILENETFSHE